MNLLVKLFYYMAIYRTQSWFIFQIKASNKLYIEEHLSHPGSNTHKQYPENLDNMQALSGPEPLLE